MNFFADKKMPVLTVILNGVTTVEDAVKTIREGIEEGAEAFCYQIEQLPPAERTYENLKRIIDAAEDKPTYICCYRKEYDGVTQSDEENAENLLTAMRAGAALLDIRTDMFQPSPLEITTDEIAVKKQESLIRQIHEYGAGVLMSSHVRRYYDRDQVFSLMKMQKDRGADVCKVVGEANDEKELSEAFATSALLNTELDAKYLFLVGGQNCKKHRQLGAFLGGSIFLCTVNSNPGLQPSIANARALRDALESY